MDTITVYLYDLNGYFIRAEVIDPRDPMPGPCTTTPPPETTGEQVAIYRDWKDAWDILDSKPVPPPPSAQPYQIDQERDRRISQGLVFEGKAFQTESTSDRENILGAMGDAMAAITIDGAQAGDLRWADPNFDFFWIASDNSRVPMDAQTCLAFTRAAVRRKALLVIAASNLKAMQPIPVDYASDTYWPPLTTSRTTAAKAAK